MFPSCILPRIDEPLRDDAGVSVYILPHSDRIIPLDPSVRQRYPRRRHGTPFCLFAEVLTPRTAPRLRTDLAMISHLQGLSSREALAFLAQFFVMFVDSHGRVSGRESLLFGRMPEPVDPDSAQQGDQLVRAMNTPRLRLEQVLDLWTHISGHVAPARVYSSPDGSPGRPGYFWIPPIWLSPEKLKEFEANEPNPSKIPVLVEPQYAELTQRFADFYGEPWRKAGPIGIAFSGEIAALGADVVGSTREIQRISLSDRDREEFETQGFKSDLVIQITGRTEGIRGNVLYVGGARMILTDAPFKLFLKLVVQLQGTDDGFIVLADLKFADLKYGEGVDGELALAPDGMEQALSRLRKPFAGYLEGLPTNKLIERGTGKSKVRLSTHRRCITWDRGRLLLHDNAAVRQLAERLPECGPPA